MSIQLNRNIKKVAVLGAGVMGAQIAAQLANVGFKPYLFDLTSTGKDSNALINQSIKLLTKQKPEPLAVPSNAQRIIPANYDEDIALLGDCDWVIEAISERMDWKKDLYLKIAPHLKPTAWICSNTSGLSIHALAELLPENLRSQFLGVHFFNPPRYMPLVEVIPSHHTHPSIVKDLETLLVTRLGKSVVLAKDTPNFIANRIGVVSMLIAIEHTQQYKLSFDLVDKLTGPIIGRPKSATYRTADVVGLDTFSHAVKTMDDNLKDCSCHSFYQLPEWLTGLINNGSLGQKTKKGIYFKQGKDIKVYDPASQDYLLSHYKISDDVLSILKSKDWSEKLIGLKNNNNNEAQFLWATFRDLFHYAALTADSIAETLRDIDLCMRWGFGWDQGPFEIWQQAGWEEIKQAINEDIKAGKTLFSSPMPAWVDSLESGPYIENASYSPEKQSYLPRPHLDVYKRQLSPPLVLNETKESQTIVFEDDAVKLSCSGDDIFVLSLKTKMNVISSAVLNGLSEALELTKQSAKGMVIWPERGSHFSAGANINEFAEAIQSRQYDVIDSTLKTFQQNCLDIRYANFPVVAAAKGYVLGGGCELMMHCARTIAAQETYIGLVEVGIGVVPAGGGCKEMVLRAYQNSQGPNDTQAISRYFEQIAMAKASTSAQSAINYNYLRSVDTVIPNSDEILYVAKQEVNNLYEQGYAPPVSELIPVLGPSGRTPFEMVALNMKEGNFISSHDYRIACEVARVLTGGDCEAGQKVDEAYLLKLEREAFISLLQTEETGARIKHMLTTGKALRN